MTYSRFDLVLAVFPFTERRGQKQRPVVVLSHREFNNAHSHFIVAMVTTASVTKWPSDLKITDYPAAGLKMPSVVRMKLFTLQEDLVIGRLGTLAGLDQIAMAQHLRSILPQ